jgi:phosphatidylglycerophosphatase C
MTDNINPTNEKKLALFDFDGTITTRDTYIEFLQSTVGKGRFARGMLFLLPVVIAYYLGLISAHRAKEIMMTHFFKDMAEEEFAAHATRFAHGKMISMIKQSALDRIAWHKQQGHDVVVVSASISYWLLPWCQKYELDLIATELEIKDNRISGKLASPNCKNQEKVKRIKARFPLEQYSYIYAYGNSSGDKEMLELANEKYYQNFK